jgi:filamentous hemagglutinin
MGSDPKSPERIGAGVGFVAGIGVNVLTDGAGSAGESIIAGRIGASGKYGEDVLKALGGESQVSFKTSLGRRVIDQFVNGIANESKVGYQSLTQSNGLQIAKEVLLKQGGDIQGSAWHFFTSPVTGLGGPSGPLMNALLSAGIKVVIH